MSIRAWPFVVAIARALLGPGWEPVSPAETGAGVLWLVWSCLCRGGNEPARPVWGKGSAPGRHSLQRCALPGRPAKSLKGAKCQ